MCKKCSHGWNNLTIFYPGSTWQSSPFFLAQLKGIQYNSVLRSTWLQFCTDWFSTALPCLAYVASMALFCSTVRKREGGFPQHQNIILCVLCNTVAKNKFPDYSLVFLELFAGRSIFLHFKWMIVLQSRKSISKDQSLGKWCCYFELKISWTLLSVAYLLNLICRYTKNCLRERV